MFCPTDLSYFPSPRSPPHPNLYVEASHMSYGSLSEEENGRSNDIGEVLASNVTGPNHTAQSQSSNSPGESDLHHSEIDSSRDGSPEIVIMANKLLANQKSPVHPSTGVTFGDIPSVSDSSNCPIVQEDPTDLVTAGADIDQCVQTLSSTEEHPTMLPTRNPASDTQSDDYFEDAVDEISEDIANGSKTQSKDLQFTDDVQLVQYKILLSYVDWLN